MISGEKKIIQIGNVYQTQFDNPTRGRVYSVKGLAPTISTCGGGGVNEEFPFAVTTRINANQQQFLIEYDKR